VLVELAGANAKQPRELWWIDLASGQRRRIAEDLPSGSISYFEQPVHQISNDGSRVLFFWASERSTLWFCQQAGEPRPLAHADDGFVSAVLSGDGRVAWALSAGGRLLRIPIDGGPVEEVLGRLPGSAMTFTASGFDFPVIDDRTRDRVDIQIPWEFEGPRPCDWNIGRPNGPSESRRRRARWIPVDQGRAAGLQCAGDRGQSRSGGLDDSCVVLQPGTWRPWAASC
jgi:hypothetical protein